MKKFAIIFTISLILTAVLFSCGGGGGGCSLIEAKLTEHAGQEDTTGIRKLFNQLSRQTAIPAELNPLSAIIVCNTKGQYSIPVSSGENQLKVKVKNIVDAVI